MCHALTIGRSQNVQTIGMFCRLKLFSYDIKYCLNGTVDSIEFLNILNHKALSINALYGGLYPIVD